MYRFGYGAGYPAKLAPRLRRTSERFFRALPRRVQAEGFGLFRRKDQGHLRGALALFAAHRDLRAAVRAGPDLTLLLGHGPRGAAVGAGEALPPRESPQAAVQSVREPSPPSRATTLSYPGTRTPSLALIRPSARKVISANFGRTGFSEVRVIAFEYAGIEPFVPSISVPEKNGAFGGYARFTPGRVCERIGAETGIGKGRCRDEDEPGEAS